MGFINLFGTSVKALPTPLMKFLTKTSEKTNQQTESFVKRLIFNYGVEKFYQYQIICILWAEFKEVAVPIFLTVQSFGR